MTVALVSHFVTEGKSIFISAHLSYLGHRPVTCLSCVLRSYSRVYTLDLKGIILSPLPLLFCFTGQAERRKLESKHSAGASFVNNQRSSMVNNLTLYFLFIYFFCTSKLEKRISGNIYLKIFKSSTLTLICRTDHFPLIYDSSSKG